MSSDTGVRSRTSSPLQDQDQITSLSPLLRLTKRKRVFAKFGSRQLAQNCQRPPSERRLFIDTQGMGRDSSKANRAGLENCPAEKKSDDYLIEGILVQELDRCNGDVSPNNRDVGFPFLCIIFFIPSSNLF